MCLRSSNCLYKLLLLGAALVSTPLAVSAGEFLAYHENVLGTSLELRTSADSAEAAAWAEEQVLREVDRLAAILSNHDPKSEFRRWQTTSSTPVKVSNELLAVLRASEEWKDRSGGAFDPRVEALTRLWSVCAKLDRTPTPEELTSTQARMSRASWRLDARHGTAERQGDCPISLDAIAKGFIIERACNIALDRSRGVHGLVLNIGGDLRVCGETTQTVTIADPTRDSDCAEPLSRVEVKGRSVATSSNSQRGFRIGDTWYSHIFDPRTGRPVDSILSATVIADRADVADALATTCNVLPPSESLRLADSLPNVGCLLVDAKGRVYRSRGWPSESKPASPAVTLADARAPENATASQTKGPEPDKPASSWKDEFELLLSFEIQAPAGAPGRYRRPFVAVWVEDKDGASVRTLLLWAQKNARSQWVPDLRRWYRRDQTRRQTDELDLRKTLSRATRPPGRYDVVWNGTDDHGRSVPAGEYTVYIEAAREHGTYQLIHQRVTLADQPFAEELKGNVEIKSARLDYRRRGPAR